MNHEDKPWNLNPNAHQSFSINTAKPSIVLKYGSSRSWAIEHICAVRSHPSLQCTKTEEPLKNIIMQIIHHSLKSYRVHTVIYAIYMCAVLFSLFPIIYVGIIVLVMTIKLIIMILVIIMIIYIMKLIMILIITTIKIIVMENSYQ